MKVTFARCKGQWFYRGLPITKHDWQVPMTCTSYRLHLTPSVHIEADTLRELRGEIEEMESDGWEESVKLHTKPTQ